MDSTVDSLRAIPPQNSVSKKLLAISSISCVLIHTDFSSEYLGKNNLFDVYSPNEAPVATCTKEDSMIRTLTGICNDLQNPAMGSLHYRFGRNVPINKTFPDENLLEPNPRAIAQKTMVRDKVGGSYAVYPYYFAKMRIVTSSSLRLISIFSLRPGSNSKYTIGSLCIRQIGAVPSTFPCRKTILYAHRESILSIFLVRYKTSRVMPVDLLFVRIFALLVPVR